MVAPALVLSPKSATVVATVFSPFIVGIVAMKVLVKIPV
jgi:hypothetical protein